ncbi:MULTISPECIES: carbonic anhydrase [unclassified Duganella]|uniref:carbonic anhydrase n=1 Tax=unclassified Duganella TaxID=2636909 RepID=UPI00088F4CD8|nr:MULTISPECIES: carbonic anhydrase [unclassified Duganella]SDG42397.1 carbonic anhydrase [Duganella sp. OV458]SDJ61567.1 carbonic anhydrase [Duganella sp. OV510]
MQDIEKFISGFNRFQQQYFNENPDLYGSLRTGQHPHTLLIGCCDSRVDPLLLTGSNPGDMFIVRNIANLVPPCTPSAPPGVSSAIEFAVCDLEVDRIIVLGHARCGGIRALMSPTPRVVQRETDFVGQWMRIAEPVAARVKRELAHRDSAEQHHACELASILQSLDNLLTYPWLKRRVDDGKLKIHGWYFDLESGALMAYSARQQQFLPLVCPLTSVR